MLQALRDVRFSFFAGNGKPVEFEQALKIDFE